MANRKQIKERTSEKVKREQAPIPWQYFAMGLLCAAIMAVGFFFAAKQHFSSVELSMKNSDMRKAKQNLEAEQRKLRVEREEVSAPATIERAGLKIGLRKFTSDDFQFIDAMKNAPQPDSAKTIADNKSKSLTEKNDTVKIVKTVSVRPVDGEKKDQSARSAKADAAKAAAAKGLGKETGRTLIAKK
ncbi:MAG TPA: hypothetical protein VGO50_09785 [Pyrinomonadaceae bacterium]|jgi:hypothetical protein|nr:hypothetical protein [Pyrinomonadaceae bacterium]